MNIFITVFAKRIKCYPWTFICREGQERMGLIWAKIMARWARMAKPMGKLQKRG
jgi:hypothetical protein